MNRASLVWLIVGLLLLVLVILVLALTGNYGE